MGVSSDFFLNTENYSRQWGQRQSVGWLPQVLGVLVATIRCLSPELYWWLSHPNWLMVPLGTAPLEVVMSKGADTNCVLDNTRGTLTVSVGGVFNRDEAAVSAQPVSLLVTAL